MGKYGNTPMSLVLLGTGRDSPKTVLAIIHLTDCLRWNMVKLYFPNHQILELFFSLGQSHVFRGPALLRRRWISTTLRGPSRKRSFHAVSCPTAGTCSTVTAWMGWRADQKKDTGHSDAASELVKRFQNTIIYHNYLWKMTEHHMIGPPSSQKLSDWNGATLSQPLTS